MRYVLTELGQGLRRNVSMHVAVVLTLFVSLTLVGIGVLLHQQADRAEEAYGSKLQVTAFLCVDQDRNPACTGEVTAAQKRNIESVIKSSDDVASYYSESKQTAFDKAKDLFGDKNFTGPHPALTVDDLPESYWITLQNPDDFEDIESAVQGLDGVASIRDDREVLRPIYGTIDALQRGALVTAALLVLAALLMVANTVRLAAFARRREIGIMRLVGASTFYIAVPFLLEALVTAAIGLLLAGGTLAALMRFGVHDRFRSALQFLPWVGTSDYLWALVVIAVVAPVLTVLPTLALTGKYIRV